MPRIVNGVERFSLSEYQQLIKAEQKVNAPAGQNQYQDAFKQMLAADQPGKPNKYGAEKTISFGIKFDSKAEARRNDELKLMLHCKTIRWFNRQPSFLLTGGVRYRPDFIVCDNQGIIWLEDVKGHPTKEFIIKAKQFRELYPDIELKLIK